MAGNNVDVGHEWVYVNLHSHTGVAVDEPGWNPFAANTDDGDAGSEQDDCYSDYSNEGRLERPDESDDHDDLDHVKGALPEADYSARRMRVPVPAGFYADEEDASSGDDEDDCSVYSNEGRLERAYQSDEDLEQDDDEDEYSDNEGADLATSDMKKLLDKLLDDESDYSTFYLDTRKMLQKLTAIVHRREAARVPPIEHVHDNGYGGSDILLPGHHDDYLLPGHFSESLYGDNSGWGYAGGGGGYGGISSNYYGGGGGGYYGGISGYDYGGISGYDYGGGLSDFDYGSGRDDGGLSDFDYDSGTGFHGGISDFNYSSRRGHYGGMSNYDYGHGGGPNRYFPEGYYGQRYHYPGELHTRMYRPYHVPAYTPPHSSPMPEAEAWAWAPDMGSWI